MDFGNLAIRVLFLLPTTVGILGNLFLVVYYLGLYYREFVLKPIDLILTHLMAANALILLSTGVPQTMSVWGLKGFVNPLGCRPLLLIQGSGQSMSISTTCLLSVFQTITINPRKSCWEALKVKAVRYLGCSVSLLWVWNFLLNSISFVYSFTKRNVYNVTRIRDYGYCSLRGSDNISDSLYTVFVVCPEIFFSLLIAFSSVSMIVILYRHKQRVQHIRSSHNCRRTSPESRATQNVLAVVSTVLAFCTLTSIMRGCIAFFHNHNSWLVTANHLTSLGFPTFAPFVLMSHYSIVSSLAWLRKKIAS